MFKKVVLTIFIVFIPAFAHANVIASCTSQLRQGNIEQAIMFGKLAVVEHSNNPASYVCLAIAYAKDKHYNFAKVELEEALILSKSQNLQETIKGLLNSINNKLSNAPNISDKALNADNRTH